MAKAVQPKKSLGQHFLADVNICRKIVAFAAIKPEDTVIEIGPGTGNLTAILLERGRRVIGIEYDREMIDHLSSRFSMHSSPTPRLEIVQADILSLAWEELLRLLPFQRTRHSPAGSWSLVPATLIGNLPYNISTRILSSMTKLDFRFQRSIFMIQREVANRITAGPGGKDYGYFSLLMQFHFDVHRGFDVPPGAFTPRPKVTSQVIRLVPHVTGALDPVRYRQFVIIIRSAFSQRRKTLWNNLKPVVGDQDVLSEGFASCNLVPDVRPEQVTLGQYLCMTRMLSFPS